MHSGHTSYNVANIDDDDDDDILVIMLANIDFLWGLGKKKYI